MAVAVHALRKLLHADESSPRTFNPDHHPAALVQAHQEASDV
jgi:hypothetical protein